MFLPSRRHSLWPGIAPSRENANVIRDALVTHAMPQKICPTVEMKITNFAVPLPSAEVMIASAGKPAALMAFRCAGVAANVSAISTIHPTTAE